MSASIKNRALRIQQRLGTRVAARYLFLCDAPLEVAVRVLAAIR